MSPRPVPPNPARRRVPVVVLGATGVVGQTFVRLLAGHPWFEVVAVAASEQGADKSYGEAVRWREATPLPDVIARLPLTRCDPFDVPIAFSALDDAVAGPVEEAFARAGTLVVTNASAQRMNPVVPSSWPR
jgi:aspartate-semialdehyde dehydrogenase